MTRRRLLSALLGLAAAVLAGWRSIIKWPARRPVGPPPKPDGTLVWKIGDMEWWHKGNLLGNCYNCNGKAPAFEYWDGRRWRPL